MSILTVKTRWEAGTAGASLLGDIIICKQFSSLPYWSRSGGFAIQSWFWLRQDDCGEPQLLGQPAVLS